MWLSDRSFAEDIAWVLTIIGVLVLVPVAWWLALGPVTDADAAVATADVARFPLDTFRAQSPVRSSFKVPDTRQWTRILKEWGDHRYIVYATQDRYPASPWIIPFSTLSLDVDVSRAGLAIPVQRAVCPYGVSSETHDCGVDFKADPGDTLDVSLILEKPRILPAGSLVIEPFWDGFMKDRLVGASITSEIEQPFFRRLATLGVSLLVASGVIRMLYSIQRRRT